MASSINASTSGAGGVITTADNSGILNLQSNGTTVATVSSTGFSTPANQTINTANTFGFKNRVINGNMAIDQWNSGNAKTGITSSQAICDRWSWQTGTTGATVTIQQASISDLAGFTKAAYVTVTSPDSSSTSNRFYQISHFIEGLNVADLGWGTANAKSLTISFWIKTSVTGTYQIAFGNDDGSRNYTYVFTVSSANTWQQVSATIPGPTNGTWLTTNAIGVGIRLGVAYGSSYSGATANTWNTISGYTNGFATTTNTFISTNGATLYLTGVQFEIGSQATSFDYRSYTTEFQMCQRYMQAYGGAVSNQFLGTCWEYSAQGAVVSCLFPVAMRTTPSLSYSAVSDWAAFSGGAGGPYQCTNILLNRASPTSMAIEFQVSSGFTAGQAGAVLANNTTNARIFLSAEL